MEVERLLPPYLISILCLTCTTKKNLDSIMEYSKIIAITGLPGLFELINSKTDGGIVRSLDDKSTRFVSSRVHQFSHLESIEVYTTRHNVNLVDVLKAMENNKEKLPDEKDAAGIKSYFQKVYPELDFDRVYSSDLKKMVKWFSVLAKNNVEIKLSEPPTESEPEAEVTVEEKPAKKAAAVKEVPKAEEKKPTPKTGTKTEEKKSAVKSDSKSEKKPAKKAAEEEKPSKKAAPKKAAPAGPKEEKKSTAKPAAKKPAAKKK
jgi:Domain of unknown function (DUF5606)